jgi:hypothetical protein
MKTERPKMNANKSASNDASNDAERLAAERRAALKKLGRFVAISAPAVTLMLAAGSKSAKAQPCSPCSSSRQFKTPEGAVDTAALLSSAQRMPLQVGAIRADDFRTAFGLGGGKTIHPLDGIGVCLASIQALNERIGSLESAFGQRA